MSYICLDANIVVKLLLLEPDSASAAQLWDKRVERKLDAVAPMLLTYEVLSTIRRRVYRGLLLQQRAAEACHVLGALPVLYVHNSGLSDRAFELATQFNQPTIYDTLYLAVAEAHNCAFWTADEAFFKTTSARFPAVHLLAQFEGLAAHVDS